MTCFSYRESINSVEVLESKDVSSKGACGHAELSALDCVPVDGRVKAHHLKSVILQVVTDHTCILERKEVENLCELDRATCAAKDAIEVVAELPEDQEGVEQELKLISG